MKNKLKLIVSALFFTLIFASPDSARADTFYFNYMEGAQPSMLVLNAQLYTNTPLVSGASLIPHIFTDITFCGMYPYVGGTYNCNNYSNYNNNQFQFSLGYITPITGSCPDGSTPYLGGAHAHTVSLPYGQYSGDLYLDNTTVPNFTQSQYCTFTTQTNPLLNGNGNYHTFSSINLINNTYTIPNNPSACSTNPVNTSTSTIVCSTSYGMFQVSGSNGKQYRVGDSYIGNSVIDSFTCSPDNTFGSPGVSYVTYHRICSPRVDVR